MVFENFCSFFMVTFKIFSKTSSIEHVCPGSKKLDTNFNHHWSQVKTGQFQIFGAIVFSGRVKEEGKIPVKNFTDPEPNHLWTNSTIRNLDSHFKPKFPTHRFQPKNFAANKFCKNCNRSGHNDSECFKNKSKSFITKSCNYCKKPGHLISECRKLQMKGETRSENSNSKFCNYCKNPGHEKTECYKLKNQGNKMSNQNSQESKKTLNFNSLPVEDALLRSQEIIVAKASTSAN